MGGDRDGHPLVTAEVTRQTLDDLRLHGLLLLQRQLAALARQSQPVRSSAAAARGVARSRPAAGRRRSARAAGRRSQSEPEETWRQLVGLMLARLPLESVYPEGGRLSHGAGRYQRADELLADLRVLYDSLMAVGAWRVADDAVAPVIRTVQTFGFHLASLDVRQNSRFHDLAIAQLQAAAGFERADFPRLERRPPAATFSTASSRRRGRSCARTSRPVPKRTPCWATYRVLVEHLRDYGAGTGLGALIVSMTRSAVRPAQRLPVRP